MKARKLNNDFVVTVKGNFNYIDIRNLVFLKLEKLINYNQTFHLFPYPDHDICYGFTKN